MFYKHLHGLRGLASLMVFLVHITDGYNMHVSNIFGRPEEIGTFQYYISNVGSFGVEIFFFLSGFVIYKSSLSEKESDFFIRRFFRIYPIFLLFSIIFIIGNFYANLEPERNNITNVLLALSFLNVFSDAPALTPNSWSVVYEVWYYLGLFYFTSFFIKHEKITLKHLFAFAVMAWFIVMKPITIYFILGALMCGQIGNISKHLGSYTKLYVNFFSFMILAILTYFVAIGVNFGGSGWFNALTTVELILPVLLLAFMVLLMHDLNMISIFLQSRWLLFLGTISYTLYLLHPYTYRVVRYIIVKVEISNTTLEFVLFIISTIFVTLFASHIVSFLIELPIYKRFAKKGIYK
jgi:peptidoglycan/LPS O-acetylase OafA/YrhL